MFISSPEQFADWFNEKYPGAYRPVTTEDIQDMTNCGLIGRYRFYREPQDGEIVRGILQYEQLREKRSTEETHKVDRLELSKCKRCGQSLPLEPEDKTGRPKEYCPDCEPFRNRARVKDWRRRQKK